MLAEALKYLHGGYSIIPCINKKPIVKWEPYQINPPTEDQVKAWWEKDPNAQIGLITGLVSGVVVIDIDDIGAGVIDTLLPEDLKTPISMTPSGGNHYFFLSPSPPMANNAKIVPGCDFRGEGGFVVVPPSPGYHWLEGFSIFDLNPIALPHAYISYINNNAFSLYKGESEEKTFPMPVSHKESQIITNRHNFLTLGRRDNDLFHVANALARARTPVEDIRECLEILAKYSVPEFPEQEMKAKIESALRRMHIRDGSVAEDVRLWIMSQDGTFRVTSCHKEAQIVTKEQKHAARQEIQRLKHDGIIEKYGKESGVYRRVDKECKDIDILGVTDTFVDVHWPFQIEKLVKTLPSNIIVVAGEANAGKSAFLLNVAWMNQDRFNIYYFSSEMAALELKSRLVKFPNTHLSKWKTKFKERSSNFADVIYPNDINIVDFLELTDEFYKVGGYLNEIYHRLEKGIAIVAIQKNPGTDYGLGGARSIEIARLYLAIKPGEIKIMKGKNWASEKNPHGLIRHFKLVQGAEFIPMGDWVHEYGKQENTKKEIRYAGSEDD